eukprot:scaffold6319_cov107-Isochrysis_galbana.AAC.8
MSATAAARSPSAVWRAAYTAVRPPATRRTCCMSSCASAAADPAPWGSVGPAGWQSSSPEASASSPTAERKVGAVPSRASASAMLRPTPPGVIVNRPGVDVPGSSGAPAAGEATRSDTVPPTTTGGPTESSPTSSGTGSGGVRMAGSAAGAGGKAAPAAAMRLDGRPSPQPPPGAPRAD